MRKSQEGCRRSSSTPLSFEPVELHPIIEVAQIAMEIRESRIDKECPERGPMFQTDESKALIGTRQVKMPPPLRLDESIRLNLTFAVFLVPPQRGDEGFERREGLGDVRAEGIPDIHPEEDFFGSMIVRKGADFRLWEAEDRRTIHGHTPLFEEMCPKSRTDEKRRAQLTQERRSARRVGRGMGGRVIVQPSPYSLPIKFT